MITPAYPQFAAPAAGASSGRGAPSREALLRAGARWRGAPRGARARGVRAAVLDTYHYPAEQCSRRPSPRGQAVGRYDTYGGGGACPRRPISAGPMGAHLPGQAASTTTRLSSAHAGRAPGGGKAAGRYSTQPELISRVRTCTSTRLSSAHAGRAHGGQAAGRYVVIPSGAECAFLMSAGRRAGPVVHVWPGPGRAHGVW